MNIEWEFEYWTEPQESLAAIKGIDENGNEYEATCECVCGEFVNITDIEKIK